MFEKRLTFYVSEKVHNKKIYYSIRHIYLDVFFFYLGKMDLIKMMSQLKDNHFYDDIRPVIDLKFHFQFMIEGL